MRQPMPNRGTHCFFRNIFGHFRYRRGPRHGDSYSPLLGAIRCDEADRLVPRVADGILRGLRCVRVFRFLRVPPEVLRPLPLPQRGSGRQWEKAALLAASRITVQSRATPYLQLVWPGSACRRSQPELQMAPALTSLLLPPVVVLAGFDLFSRGYGFVAPAQSGPRRRPSGLRASHRARASAQAGRWLPSALAAATMS